MAWKHAQPIRVHRQGAEAFESNRGTGQGDADAPFEASIVQGGVSRGARRCLYREIRATLATAGPLVSSEVDIEAIRKLDAWEKDAMEWEGVVRSAGAASNQPERWKHPGNRIAEGSRLVHC